MAKTYKSIEELKNNCVVIRGTIKVYWPQYHQQEFFDSAILEKFNGCYSSNNSTLCFVDQDVVFVTPFTSSSLKCLMQNGFRSDSFYVPFSNWDYPLKQKEFWVKLRQMAEEEYAEEVCEQCIKFSEKNGIGSLSPEVLENCFQIPKKGVPYRYLKYQDCYYPLVHCFDCTTPDKLGKYCTNNGRVVFVHKDGNTFVAKGYKILQYLQRAGYTEAGLFVPFSNGEEILDPTLAYQWNSLKKF